MPALRFPEFNKEWENKKLGEVSITFSGGTPLTSNKDYYNGVIPFIRSGEVSSENTELSISLDALKNSSAKLVKKGDLLYALYGATSGEVAISKINGAINQAVLCIRTELDNYFTYNFLLKNKNNIIKTYLQGGQGNLSADIVKSLLISYPTLPEQQKIASFFTAIDSKISLLKKKKELLEQYKKGVMQKIFSQVIRFKDDNGKEFPEWEKKKLGDVADRMVNKNIDGNANVLTISAQNGLVSQLDFFNNSVSAKDVTGYYLLKTNDFAYNKSYSNGYPMGAIKRLKLYEKGVVSTLYICFTFHDTVNLSFMEQYFESGIHNKQIEKVAQEGARNHGLLNIGVGDFFSTEMIIPSFAEQSKIANFLSAIDDKINHTLKQIEKAEVWKKGLLQKMFV